MFIIRYRYKVRQRFKNILELTLGILPISVAKRRQRSVGSVASVAQRRYIKGKNIQKYQSRYLQTEIKVLSRQRTTRAKKCNSKLESDADPNCHLIYDSNHKAINPSAVTVKNMTLYTICLNSNSFVHKKDNISSI